jgi:hypothetical protein
MWTRNFAIHFLKDMNDIVTLDSFQSGIGLRSRSGERVQQPVQPVLRGYVEHNSLNL